MWLVFEDAHFFELALATFVVSPILLLMLYMLAFVPSVFGIEMFAGIALIQNASGMLVVLWAIIVTIHMFLLAGFLMRLNPSTYSEFFSLLPLVAAFITIFLILIFSQEFAGKILGFSLRDNFFALLMLQSALTGLWFGFARTSELAKAATYVPAFMLITLLLYSVACFLIPAKEPLSLYMLFKL